MKQKMASEPNPQARSTDSYARRRMSSMGAPAEELAQATECRAAFQHRHGLTNSRAARDRTMARLYRAFGAIFRGRR
jgi:hypothetical protein